MESKGSRAKRGYVQRPSSFLRGLEEPLLGLGGGLALDVGCGTGRNAQVLREMGFDVVCVDKDSEVVDALVNSQGLSQTPGQNKIGRRLGVLMPVIAELSAATWPFGDSVAKLVISIDFLDMRLLESFGSSLKGGGLLVIETVSGHGGNYLELPERGSLKQELSNRLGFELLMYSEREVGPAGGNAVAAKLVAVKRQPKK